MEHLDTLIQEAMQPYMNIITTLKNEMNSKEAEIVTLKLAILQLDNKNKELEERVKKVGTSRPGMAGRAGLSSSRTYGTATSRTRPSS